MCLPVPALTHRSLPHSLPRGLIRPSIRLIFRPSRIGLECPVLYAIRICTTPHLALHDCILPSSFLPGADLPPTTTTTKHDPTFDRHMHNAHSRFRPNIVVSGLSKPWLEDTWAEIAIVPSNSSSSLAAGENGDKNKEKEGRKRINMNRISLVSKGTRCLLPNVNPEDGVRDDAVPFKVRRSLPSVLSEERD